MKTPKRILVGDRFLKILFIQPGGTTSGLLGISAAKDRNEIFRIFFPRRDL